MPISSVGPASVPNQVPANRAAWDTQPVENTSAVNAAKDQEDAKAKRAMTPEEQEELRRTLAGMATQEFRNILTEDAKRQAEVRAAQGLSPAGVVVDISV